MNERELASLPAVVQMTAHTHIAMLERLLPGWLVGWYAVGSAALGCFDRRVSDLDFVAVVRRSLGEDELAPLRRAHRALDDRRLFAPLDGLYVAIDAFAGGDRRCLRFNDGRFHEPVAFSPYSPAGWVLKHCAAAFLGPEPAALPFEPDWALVAAGMRQNLSGYWRAWAAGCRNPADPRWWWLNLSPAALEWCVLGVSRIRYSLMEGGIAGKEAAGRQALSTAPVRFHPVILEALRRRDASISRQYASPAARRRAALDYLDYVIGEWGDPAGR